MQIGRKEPSQTKTTQSFSTLRKRLLSVAGLIGHPIINQEGQPVGKIHDLVFRWDEQEPYPSLRGVVARVDNHKVWVGAASITKLTAREVKLRNTHLDLRDFKPREGEILLAEEVLDHQLIDVTGARVVRASDLYIANVASSIRLVGVDVSLRSILRRLGPRFYRSRSTPDAVIDWATIQSFGGQGIRLTTKSRDLHHLRPGELADLLEDLGRDERRELLQQLPTEQAADALEEMEASEVEAILRESSTLEAASYLSYMEPDEAADALRDVDDGLRQDLIDHMNKDSAEKVEEVLHYDKNTAGGCMNTSLFILQNTETAATAKSGLELSPMNVTEIESIVLVDARGKLIYDLPIAELLFAQPHTRLQALAQPQKLVTVSPDASIHHVAELLIESRRSSILVADDFQKPLGRIFADDIVDALLPGASKLHFPRLFS